MKITTTRKEYNNTPYYLICFETDAKTAIYRTDKLKTKLTFNDLFKVSINDVEFSNFGGELACLDYSPNTDKLKYWAAKFLEEISAMDLMLIDNEIRERIDSNAE